MKYAICNETYVDWTLEKTCEDIASHGYQGVEVAPFTLKADPTELTEKEAAAAGDTIRSFGLVPVGLHWLLSKPVGLHMTTPDKALRRKTTDFLKHLVRLNAAMGGNVMVFGSPMSRNLVDGSSYEDAFERSVEVFSEMAAECDKFGGTIALEPLATKETDFMYTAQQGIDICEAVDNPHCRLHLDVKAMSDEDKEIAQIIRDSAPWIEHFHANDPNLRGPGTGEVKFEPIYEALRDINYDKWVSIEVFKYDPDAPTIAREGIEFLKAMEKKIMKSVEV